MEKAERTIVLPVCGKETRICEGDGHSDRALLKKKKRLFEVVPDYLASMTLTIDGEKADPKRILQLATPDQEYLAIEIYKLNYGDIFEFKFTCPQCGEVQEGEANLEDLDFTEPPVPPTVSGTLPRSGKEFVVGMLTGKKEQLLFKRALEAGPDLNQADYLSLVTLDGQTDFSYEEVVNLPLADHKAIRKARKQLICGYDTVLNIECEKCEEITPINMLMHADFFFSGG